MSNNGPFFLIKNFGCTQHSSSKLGSVFAGTKFLLFLHFVSARNAWTAVLLFSIHHTIFYMFKRHVLTQISQIYADKRQAGKWNYNYNNGRSRVSRGNKMQKLRKFRANEYRVKFTWTMLSAAEILYQKKRPNINHWALSARKKTHINVYRKNYRKNSLEKSPLNELTHLLLSSCK